MKLCNVCGSEIPDFKKRVRTDSSISKDCPICDSYDRHRALIAQYGDVLKKDGVRVLHIGGYAPVIHHLFTALESLKDTSYIPIDQKPTTKRTLVLDITRQVLQIEPVDYIICLHVLEHIIDEDQAMQNISKNLKKGGRLILDVPLKGGKTDRGYDSDEENAKFKDVKKDKVKVLGSSQRLSKFGNEGHFRMYGKSDILDFVNAYGFNAKFVKVKKDDNIGLEKDYQFIEGEKL